MFPGINPTGDGMGEQVLRDEDKRTCASGEGLEGLDPVEREGYHPLLRSKTGLPGTRKYRASF